MTIKRKKPGRLIRPQAMLLAAALLISLLLAGCSTDEITLVTALMNEPDKLSYEFEGGARMSLKFDFVANTDSDDLSVFIPSPSILSIIEAATDGVGFDISAKCDSNAEQTKSKVEIMLTPYVFGGRLEKLKTGIWADVDFEKPEYLFECIQLPKMFAASIPMGLMKGKDYLTITNTDAADLLKNIGRDTSDLMDQDSVKLQQEAVKTLTKAFAQGFVSIAGLLDTQSAYVKAVERDESGGAVYRVKITDKGLKEIIKSFISIGKGDMKELLRMYLTAAAEYLHTYTFLDDVLPDTGSGPFSGSLDAILAEFDASFDSMYPLLLPSMKDFAKSTKKFKILGDEGITLDIAMSDEGFITGIDWNAELIVDLRGYEIAAGNRFDGELRKVHIFLTFNSRYTSINEDVEIAMPAITKKNSLSYSKLMNALLEQLEGYGYMPEQFYEIDPGVAYDRSGSTGGGSQGGSYGGRIPSSGGVGGSADDAGSGDAQDRPDMLGIPPVIEVIR